jgi:hypothetical protein
MGVILGEKESPCTTVESLAGCERRLLAALKEHL